MIFDKLENIKYYKLLSSNFNIGFEYLVNNNLSNFEVGTYPIKGKEIFCNIEEYYTQDFTTKYYESHNIYADIQCILLGIDYMGYKDTAEAVVRTIYNESKDITFYKDKIDENLLKVSQGSFCVFFPNEGHVSGITKTTRTFVKKAVIKIKIG